MNVHCPSQVTRLWNRLAKTEPVNPDGFIGWAKDKFAGSHPEWDGMYLQFFIDWAAQRSPEAT